LESFFEKENSTINLSRISYQKIYAHKDLDGLFGGGLLLRIYEVPIKFLSRILSARNSIIVEVPLSSMSMIENCIIIDHHYCKNPLLLNVRFSNYIICDESYPSVTSLIADYFELEIPEEILSAINDIEKGIVEEGSLSGILYIGYIATMNRMPFQKIAQDIKSGNWERIIRWFEKRANSKDAELVKQLAKIKAENANILINRVRIILYKATDSIEVGAARLALIKIQEENDAGVILGYEGQFAKKGMMATKRRKIDLLKVLMYLEENGWSAGGRRDVGGFKIPEGTTVNQAIEYLRRAFLTILK